MVYAVAEELRDYLRSNIDMTKITKFATRPVIITIDAALSSDSSGAIASGVLELNNERKQREHVTHSFINEYFTIEGIMYIDGLTDKVPLDQYLTEIEDQFRTSNNSTSRSYYYTVQYVVESYYPHALVAFEFVLKRELVKVVA